MAITTYSELVTAVSNWLARNDLSARIPEFISLAEAKFNRDLRCNQMEIRATATVDLLSCDPEFISLPGDFQTMRRVRLASVQGKPRLEFRSGAQADDIRYANANCVGQPRYFTIFGDEMELVPTPGEAYEIEMIYRSYIPPLGVNSTNWLLALAPDAYLYGTLLESAPYIKEDARISTWAQGYSYAVDGLNRLAMDQAFNAGPATVTVAGYTP